MQKQRPETQFCLDSRTRPLVQLYVLLALGNGCRSSGLSANSPGRYQGCSLNMPLVFILDDQATNRLLLSKLAHSIETELEVMAFEDPSSALAECAQRTPDLIISDYKMPSMSGAEFIRRLRAMPHCHDIPVIVLTAYHDREIRMRALEAGATDFLLTPLDSAEFASRARNLLHLRAQQKLLEDRAYLLAHELEVSERSREEAAQNDREVLAQVIDTVPAFIMAADQSGRCIFVNASQAQDAGGVPSDYVGRSVTALLGDRAQSNLDRDRQIFHSGQPMSGFEEEIVGPDDAHRVFETVKTPLRDAKQNIIAVVTISTDVTSRKAAEDRMSYMAHHDALTGLANRVLLLDRIEQEIRFSRAPRRKFALLLLDLDRFKAVNDGFGHPVGDWLLQEIAARLTESCGPDDVVARLGGDEFAILHVGHKSCFDPAHLAEHVLRAVTAPIVHQGYPLYVTASVGLTVFPDDGQDSETLQHNADLAMYLAKAEGKNTYRFFRPALKTATASALELEISMREALKCDQFRLLYQPQIDLSTGNVLGVEALLRWERPGHGTLSPDRFLRVAEETGLIGDIGAWVMRTAVQHGAQWRRQDGRGLRVAVNISPSQFLRQDMVALVDQILDETGFPADLLELELIESTLLDDRPATAEALRALSTRGVRFSIDDFGMGYASLSYFKRATISRIKIDRSYIQNFPASREDEAIVSSAVALGRALNIPVLAEGIETIQELSAVRRVGCDEAQGFYFSKPLSHDRIPAVMYEHNVEWCA
jgi:diguanylate cyclase (GGDEF)-like protein/PAS domain S-box-containing protein